MGAARVEATTKVRQNNPVTIPNTIFLFTISFFLLSLIPLPLINVQNRFPRLTSERERFIVIPSKARNLTLINSALCPMLYACPDQGGKATV
jgi:hypothetical protein